MSTKPLLGSLNLIWDQAKATAEEQKTQITSLDTKAGFVLGSGSVLAAGVASFQGGFQSLPDLIRRGTVPGWIPYLLSGLVLLTLGAYLAVLLLSFLGYATQRYQGIGNLRELRATYLNLDEPDTRSILLWALIQASRRRFP